MLRSLLHRELHFSASLEERVTHRTEALTKSLEALARSNQELDSFVYTASHDLRTPLVNLMGLQLALGKSLSGRVSPTDASILSMMQESVERLDRTIQELASLARVSKERLPAERLFFKEAVDDVLQELDPMIKEAKAEVITSLQVHEIDYPTAYLKSILHNLLSNAVKFRSPLRMPTVEVATFCRHNRIYLQVKDNGLGLQEEQLSKVFILFKRLHDHQEGSGLGLTLVKKIVESQGGQVLISSQPDEGSCFTVIF